MDKWRHIFIDEGEYAAPDRILAGLSLAQVTTVPSKTTHSIYQELWHICRWQTIFLSDEDDLFQAWQHGDQYPTQQAGSDQEWQDLIRTFFLQLEQVLTMTKSPETLSIKLDSGGTVADSLVSLAVHNAYHLGKIVAIRQMLDAW